MTVDFSTGIVMSTLLYDKVGDMKESAFVGSNIMEVGGVQTY